MNQQETEKNLESLTPAAPGAHVRQRVAEAAQAGAASMAKSGAKSPISSLPKSGGGNPNASRALPMRSVWSVAAMLMCASAVGLMAWFANQPSGPNTRSGPNNVALNQPSTPASGKKLPATVQILNTTPPLSHPVDPTYEVARPAAFCRVVAMRGLVTGHEASAVSFRWKMLSEGDTLAAGGSLRVAGDGLSFAVVALENGSEILVGSGSELTMTSAVDLKLNGGRALVRVVATGAASTAAATKVTTSDGTTVKVAGLETVGDKGATAAAFQITDNAFAMSGTEQYIPRWKVANHPQAANLPVRGDNQQPLPRVSNLAVLQGSVQLASAARPTDSVSVNRGGHVNLQGGDRKVLTNDAGLMQDCVWMQACAIPADRGIGSLDITNAPADAGALTPIVIGSAEIRVDVRDQIALTVVDEYFVNNNDRQLEGTFYFPLPADASISNFSMWIDDRMVTGEIVERERAREIYEQILREQRDPGLLEWAGGNQFKARVFPIPPKGRKHIRISYTQVLPYHDGRVHYNYPLMSEMLRTHPLENLKMALTIHDDATKTDLRSESHAAQKAVEGIAFQAANYSPSQDFSASWIPNGQMPELKVLPHVQADEGGFYMALITPRTDAEGQPIHPVIDSSPAPHRWLFVVDASGSVEQETWALTRATLESLFAATGGEDTFNVITYDVEPRLLFPGFVPANGVNFDKVSQELSKVDPFGASNVEKAFDLAAAEAGKAGDATTLVYIGDGVASAGEQRTARLIEHIGTQFAGVKGLAGYALATGGSYESEFIDGLGRQLHGLGLHLEGLNDIANVVGQVSDGSQGGLLTDLTVTVNGVTTAQQYPAILPNLRLGDQLILTGRYTGSGNGTVVVAGKLNGKAWSKQYSTAFPEGEVAGTNKFVPRLWAKRHIAALLNKMDLEDGDLGAMKNEIIDASKKYTLITPFTSFLVLESEDDYRRFKVEHNFNMSDFGDEAKKVSESKKDSAESAMGSDAPMDLAAAKAAPGAAGAPPPPPPSITAPKEPVISRQAGEQRGEAMRKQVNNQSESGLAKERESSDRSFGADGKEEASVDKLADMDSFSKTLGDARNDERAGNKKKSNMREEQAESNGVSHLRRSRESSDKPMAGKARDLDALDDEVDNQEDRKGAADGRLKTLEKVTSAEMGMKEEKAIVGSGSGSGSYGYRSGGGRRMIVARHGGSRVIDSMFPESNDGTRMPTKSEGQEDMVFAYLQTVPADNSDDNSIWHPAGQSGASQSIGEYKLVPSQLAQPIDAKAQAALKQVAGNLSELNCTLATMDPQTGKTAAANTAFRIRSDAVEQQALTGPKTRLTSDGTWTTLESGNADAVAPLRRKAQAGDRFLVLQQAPAFVGCSLDEIAQAFDVAFVSDVNGLTTLRFTERNAERSVLLVTIDTAKGEVRTLTHVVGDAVQTTTEFGGYQALVAGVTAPTTKTVKNRDGTVISMVAFGGYSAKGR